MLQEENTKKMEAIASNVKHVKCKYKEKVDGINDKFRQIDDKIDKAEKDKRLYSMKHKELENLKFQDQEENLSALKNQRFRKHQLIDEKHIALSYMNDDKKQFMNNPQFRVINPTKSELGMISKQMLTEIISVVKSKSQLVQWKNSDADQ